MSRDDTYLVDILESAKIALDYVFDKSWDAFYEDIQCQDAVVRRIEIIGEAARRVSQETRSKYPHIIQRL
ncbi:MAG: DUF86 domain-containing protein, partial [Anaerolineales bacterium]|nr:DUF86 domain-containing protein [Anaerolineales bacterium]